VDAASTDAINVPSGPFIVISDLHASPRPGSENIPRSMRHIQVLELTIYTPGLIFIIIFLFFGSIE